MSKKFSVPRGCDMHCHFRTGRLTETVAPFTAKDWASGIIMPNTDPKILTGEDAVAYREQIIKICPGFTPYMTIYLTPKTTPQMIRNAKAMGVVAGKLYPEGVTTGSEEGISDFKALDPVFHAMSEVGMVLSIHGQKPGKIYWLDREKEFLPILVQIAHDFPELKIVMEHISTREALWIVRSLPYNVRATITLQHLLLTGNDFADASLHPHNFCIPPVQREEDRLALVTAAFSGDRKFFFGSDTAPHIRSRKECDGGKGGIFSAPVAKTRLFQLFYDHDVPHQFNRFAGTFGPEFYGFNDGHENETMTLSQEDWCVPAAYHVHGTESDEIVPFLAGHTIHWLVV